MEGKCPLCDGHRDWDLHLNELRFALNSAVHSSLGVSPAFLNLGRNPVPSTLLRNHLENPIHTFPPDLDKWKIRANRLPGLHDLVRRHMDKAVARQYAIIIKIDERSFIKLETL